MQIQHKTRNIVLTAALFATMTGLMPAPAHAASKEIIELQTQVQQLLDMVQRLQSTVDTRFGVIQHLMEQTADNANKVSALVDGLQQKLAAQNEAISGKVDTASGQVQSLNDSVDELKARLGKLDKSIQDLQAQIQAAQAPPPSSQASPAGGAPGQPGGSAPGQPAASQAPPLQDTYQAGLRDFNAAHYDVATGEFQDVIQYYPQDDLAGASQFYLGEIAYRQKNYQDAIKAYNVVLENYTDGSKAPAAQLKKGYALLAMNKREPGIQELRSLIQRHPQTPEAQQARTKLNGMGVRISSAR